MSVEQAPTPGWYDDGAGDGLWRYWNGRAWEEKYMPAPTPVKQHKWYFYVAVVVPLAVAIVYVVEYSPLRGLWGH